MPHVWAKRGLKWDGFKPRAYVLDMDKVWALTVKDDATGQDTSIGDVVSSFEGQKVQIDDERFGLKVALKSVSHQKVVTGPDMHLRLLKLIYQFADQEFSPFEVQWFYYDKDNCREDPESAYSFFLVANNTIVEERYNIFDSMNNGFDPSILTLSSDSENPVWFDLPHWEEAQDRFWYRKFYSETCTGQLMVLRPDEPTLYYYPEGRYRAVGGIEGWFSEIHRLLRGMRIAVWILVVLAVLQLYLRLR